MSGLNKGFFWLIMFLAGQSESRARDVDGIYYEYNHLNFLSTEEPEMSADIARPRSNYILIKVFDWMEEHALTKSN